MQVVVERPQTQQRAVSAWGVPQCGQRQLDTEAHRSCAARPAQDVVFGRPVEPPQETLKAAVALSVP